MHLSKSVKQGLGCAKIGLVCSIFISLRNISDAYLKFLVRFSTNWDKRSIYYIIRGIKSCHVIVSVVSYLKWNVTC